MILQLLCTIRKHIVKVRQDGGEGVIYVTGIQQSQATKRLINLLTGLWIVLLLGYHSMFQGYWFILLQVPCAAPVAVVAPTTDDQYGIVFFLFSFGFTVSIFMYLLL